MQIGTELDRIKDQIRAANDSAMPVRIEGGNSKAFYGQSETKTTQPVSTRAYEGIVAYEPTELVVTARAGTLLSTIENELAAQNQMLAFEPPRFSETTTIGGVIATGLSGPRRVSAGAARDFVLGASLINANGDELHFGGQVMKNVAGYDVSRLLCGSLGVLGVISQVSLKVLPVPNSDATLQAACTQEQALQWLNRWAGQPLPIVASLWLNDNLTLRLAGAPAAVAAAQTKLRAEAACERIDDAAALTLWANVRDQKHLFFSAAAIIRLSLPSNVKALNAPRLSEIMIEWGGALRWLAFTNSAQALQALPELQQAATALNGSAMLYRAQNSAQSSPLTNTSVFSPLDAMTLKLHQRLKAEFDPKGIFNPGRLHAAL